MSHLQTVFADADARIEGYKKTMALTVRAAGAGGRSLNPSQVYGGGGPAGGIIDSYGQMAETRAQLSAFRGHVYSAIRPIATRIAGQEIRVGEKRAVQTASPAGLHGAAGNSSPRRQKAGDSLILKNYSLQTKDISEGIDILESHPILLSLEKPNDSMVQWQLIFITIATIELAGRAFWYLYDDPVNEGRLTYWPFPPHWVRHNVDKRDIYPWAAWLVRPPGSTEDLPVAARDMCYFYYPDPLDPSSSLSPVATQAPSIIIDEKIQQSQNSSYDNGGKPGMVLEVGEMLGPDGKPLGIRHKLEPEQRMQLLNAARLVWSGVKNHGEPLILDSIINNAYPWTLNPGEMDWLDSERSKERRIFKGMGVNPISSGEMEGVNYSSSAVADEHLCSNKVNPLITMISQTITDVVGPRFTPEGGQKLLVWIDKAVPHNAELELSQYDLAAKSGVLRKNEMREYIGLKPIPKEEGGEDFIEMKPAPVAGGGDGVAGGGNKPLGGKPKPKNPAGGAASRPAGGGGGRRRRGR